MIIGFTGTLGSGKGTVVEFLKEKGFKHYSMSGFIAEEIMRRGMSVNRDTLTEVGNDLRRQYGPAHISTQLLKRGREAGGNVVIESLRSLGEVENLKKNGAVIWAVDADVRKRYGRIAGRKSEKDSVSFEKFVADEERESNNTEPWNMNLPACIALADVTIRNDGSVEELRAQVEQVLENA